MPARDAVAELVGLDQTQGSITCQFAASMVIELWGRCRRVVRFQRLIRHWSHEGKFEQ